MRFNARSSLKNLKVKFNKSNVMTAAEGRRLLLDASTTLADAIRQFKTETRPIYSTSVSKSDLVAAFSGLTARLTPVSSPYSSLQTTAKINTRTSTNRSSSSVLGLDVTSPETASTLDSSATLGLDLVAQQSSIASTAEMNTATTSYDTSTLSFSQSSSVATLSGEYTGVNSAAAATSLTVLITSNANISGPEISFDVLDQDSTVLFTFSGAYVAGDQIYLGDDIGLSISFSSGNLKKLKSASTNVNHGPFDVDPNATFNNADPNLRPRFDSGQQVTAGSFTVNGTSITVNANDTVNTVIARINASGAGVTAALANDQITLTSNAYSESDIVLANDTSGFLTAVKLAGASTTVGNISDDVQALTDTSQFAGVTNGSFVVDGQTINVDAATDTIQTIVAKINSSGARVVATYNAVQDKIEINATYNSEDDVPIGSDTSGFLAAANLSAGNSVRGNIDDDQQVFSKTSQFSGVTSGSFQINGVSISVDAGQDTVQTLIGKINSSGAGVTASYNSTTDKLEFTPDVAGATLVIEGDTSGFLAAGNIATGAEGTHVNANAAFNGTGQNSALLDDGVTVVAGSFTVNGVTITVAANDTVNTVLGKITASAAGVIAIYDSSTQTVNLTTKQGNSAPFVVGGDTSGFLAAVKFDGSEDSTSGNQSISAFDSVLSAMTEYSGVGAGTITVNGTAISIDPANTTMNGLVSALNAVGNLTATLHKATGRITVSSVSSDSPINITGDAGLLSALGMAAGTYNGTSGSSAVTKIQTGTETVSNASAVAESVSGAAAQLNDVLSQLIQLRGAVPDPTDLASIVQREINSAAARTMNGSLSQRGEVQEDNSVRSELESAVQRAFDALADAGLEGLGLGTDGENLQLSDDHTTLANSLNNLLGEEETDQAAALVDLLDGFTAETAAFSAQAAPEPQSGKLSLDLSALLKAQIPAKQTMSPATIAMAKQAYTDTQTVSGKSYLDGSWNDTDQLESSMRWWG